MPAPSQGSSPSLLLVRQILSLAVSFALVTGLVEGVFLLGIFEYGWLNVGIRHGVSPQIIWISVVCDLIIFLTASFLLLAANRFIPGLRLRLAFAVFAFLTFFDWLALPFRLRTISVFLLACGLAISLYRYLQNREAKAWAVVRGTLPALCVSAALIIGGIAGTNWWTREQALTHLPAAAPNSPNIVVVVVDTLRADHLGLYGYNRPTSPNLDAISRQGVVFDNAISPAPWTLPAHASFLTGLLPHQHGADEESPLDNRHRTLGEELQRRGYRTAAFSGNSLYFSRRAGLNRGFIDFDDYFYSPADMLSRTVWGRLFGGKLAHLLGRSQWPLPQRASIINRRALKWIDAGSRHPFFVFLNYFDLHTPRVPPQPYRSRFERVNVGPWLLADSGFPQLSWKQHMADVDAYDGAIAYDDAQLQQLFTALKARGLDQDTLVVITADHGESLEDHGILRHRNDLYRELIHVPLLFWWPGKVPAGRRIATPVSTARLATTLLDLIGQPDARNFGGNSLALLWKDPEAAKQWPYPVAEVTRNIYTPSNYPTHYGDVESIVAREWQLIQTQDRPPELYRWVTDPGEKQNLANAPGARRIVLQLSDMLRDRVSSSPAQAAGNYTEPRREGEP